MSAPRSRDVAAEISRRLTDLTDEERAEQVRRYLKLPDDDFLGVSVPQVRAVVREVVGRPRAADREWVAEVCDLLWDGPSFEHRVAAVAAARRGGVVDSLDRWYHWIRTARTWALVDEIAVHIVGSPRVVPPFAPSVEVERWVDDPDMWVRRSSLLCLLPSLRQGADDWDVFLRRADALAHEREFFITKAIGWVMREVAQRRPDDVVAALAARPGTFGAVTMREALRKLPVTDPKVGA